MNRDEYKEKLSDYLIKPYQKNSDSMYKQLQELGNEGDAIKYARKLSKFFPLEEVPYHNQNPCTTVFLLVQALNKYKDPSMAD